MPSVRERRTTSLEASRQEDPRGLRARAAGSIALIAGGILLSAEPLISNETSVGFFARLLSLFVGFSLLLIGVILSSHRSPLTGRIFLIAAAALALYGWTWFLHFGIAFEVPIWFWTITTAPLFFGAGVAYAIARQPGLSAASLFMVAGQLGTAAIAFESPIFAPPSTYIPTSAAMIAAGVSVWVLHRATRRR